MGKLAPDGVLFKAKDLVRRFNEGDVESLRIISILGRLMAR